MKFVLKQHTRPQGSTRNKILCGKKFSPDLIFKNLADFLH